jgi:hypothetical protein
MRHQGMLMIILLLFLLQMLNLKEFFEKRSGEVETSELVNYPSDK